MRYTTQVLPKCREMGIRDPSPAGNHKIVTQKRSVTNAGCEVWAMPTPSSGSGRGTRPVRPVTRNHRPLTAKRGEAFTGFAFE